MPQRVATDRISVFPLAVRTSRRLGVLLVGLDSFWKQIPQLWRTNKGAAVDVDDERIEHGPESRMGRESPHPRESISGRIIRNYRKSFSQRLEKVAIT